MSSQNIPLKRSNILKYLETNFTNWTSGNGKIDDFIQERQLKINEYDDIVLEWIPYKQFKKVKESGKNGLITAKKYPTKHEEFQVLYGISQNPDTGDYIFIQNNYTWTILEWIPYNQFNKIKETGKNDFVTVYSAIWKDGLCKSDGWGNYIRNSNEKVALLKCFHNSQESIDSLINKAKDYPTNYKAFQVLYGISQNPDTGDYILAIKNYEYDDIVLEWIPYNQFSEIKKTGKNDFVTVYLAIWKDGPLYKEDEWSDYTRNSNNEVALKCLNNSQESIDSLINETKNIQQNIKNFNGNEKIDVFVQERQLKINKYNDIVLEWIPYKQFKKVKEEGKNGLITVYSAIWEEGPLYKSYRRNDYTRNSNKEVTLKYLHNSQESTNFLINEV
ncbi:unnamed protein product [Rhizophagus irregularis]|nr:unnamed protein product [Rhizophagus irregularis]